MKKIILTSIIIFQVITGFSQLNNSWIDYSKTYYKFKIANDSMCRINQPVLAAAGLGSVPAQNFQLWRNGKEVRMYTSVPSGVLGAGDYLEFWGEMNDGKPDKNLYRNSDYQLCDKYSLETDTATYFLTVNPAGANLRYTSAVNNTAGNVLPADPYFMRRIETHYKSQINKGFAEDFGEYLYSSAYDIGEGWTSSDAAPCCAVSKDLQNMNRYAAGPANSVMFTVTAAGNAANNTRELVAKFYNTTILGSSVSPPNPPNPMPYFTYHRDTVRNLPLSLLASPSNLPVGINGNSTNINDRIVVSCFSVTYPATFNFNNEKNFYFELKNNAAGNFLVITNFNTNGVAPILYEYNTSKRYLGDISTPGQVKFALPASSDTLRKFNLISQDITNINQITSLTSKTFINYALAANQGDYVIISNPVLYNNGSGVNNVDLYRQYRSSITGGGFNAKIYDIDELNDQFGFGIKKHPSAIRDFIRYASQQFSVAPKYVFLIGRALTYTDYTANQGSPIANQLDLVQTFGWPASDVLLSCLPGTNIPLIPIGRLGAINGTEVGIYLDKMKEYEQVQQSSSQTIADKGWMKNFLHTVGGSNSQETDDFTANVNGYKAIAEDTLYGAHVETFAKSSVSTIEQLQSQRISELFHEGLSYVKYFGHSSANELAINLNYPENYQNSGKYPFMHISGCTVGNFFTYNANRINGYAGMSLSEKYVLLDHKGSIGFLGSTHFGLETILNGYNTIMYNNFCKDMYGNTIGNQIKNTIQNIGANPNTLAFITRIHLEEINLHGDPALKINTFAKPDYVIEDQLVKFTPNIITVGNPFTVDIKMMNIGRAIRDSIRVSVKQKLPNDTIRVLYNQVIPAIPYMDSLHLIGNINPITDKGLNKLIITLDVDDKVNELSELNNTLTKDFYIFEDELRPISPYNYSIVNQQNITFYGSTANPLSTLRQYIMEVDTTELFNSPFKKVYNASGTGGVIQFNPSNITFTDSTVYYWRTSTVPAPGNNYIWNNFSFVYLPASTPGFNQSHYYQHAKSVFEDISYNANGYFDFPSSNKSLVIKNGLYPYFVNEKISVTIDGNSINRYGCKYPSLQFLVLDNQTLEPWKNYNVTPTAARFGSWPLCELYSDGTRNIFEFPYTTLAYRKLAMDFIDSIPPNSYVIVNNLGWTANTSFISEWQTDQGTLGTGNSIYHKLKNLGFTQIDSFYRNIPFIFFFKKGPGSFTPVQSVGDAQDSYLTQSIDLIAKTVSGTITSPLYGPAKSWSQFHWRGNRAEAAAGDSISFNIIGVTPAGAETTLYTVDSTTKDLDISAINATQYPYLKLKMYNEDKVNATPYQLRYWRVNGTFIPEGAVAPNILFTVKDTADQGEIVDFKLAFKNISQTAFADSMNINFTITDRLNNPHPFTLPKGKVLVSGDTLIINYKIDTKNYPGANTIFVEVNPNNAQPEQYHFNNVLFKDLFVRADLYNPLLDVTFDGVHILNQDIVSSKPHILVNLKDESRFLALADTALIKVQVRFPDGTIHNYNFGGDTMRFTPANLSSGNNTATIDFLPYFPEDGDYELIVSGKDVVGNTAGAINYHVSFKVITKAMITNLLNYPNPFTTSTAFVFTITGSEVPQNMRIQILTVTGKVVREITIDELGPLHVGPNVTEFKWDGTDSYGQKLGNGVYLYRVLTNLNGKSLEKYSNDEGKTDKFFTKGYGKMVILR